MDVALRPGAGKAIPTAFLAAVMAAASLAMTASARSGACSNRRAIDVPGAAHQDVYCLEDLTTHGTLVSGRTNYDDWEGSTPLATRYPGVFPAQRPFSASRRLRAESRLTTPSGPWDQLRANSSRRFAR